MTSYLREPIPFYTSRSIPIREVFSLGLRDLIRLLTSTELFISDLVNRDISTAKGSRKPIQLDCL